MMSRVISLKFEKDFLKMAERREVKSAKRSFATKKLNEIYSDATTCLFAYNLLSDKISLKMAERSEAKSAKRSLALKYLELDFLTRSFASRF